MTPVRLRALVAALALVVFAFLGKFAQAARWWEVASITGVEWSTAGPRLSVGDGSALVAAMLLVVSLTLLAVACWWGAGAAQRAEARPPGAPTDDGGRRRWLVAFAAVWAVGAGGALFGWFTTPDDQIRATRVAAWLRDEGASVDARITSGEAPRLSRRQRPKLVPPLVIEYTVDSRLCTFVVDDPLVVTDGELLLPASC